MFKNLNEFLGMMFEENPVLGMILGVLSYGFLYLFGWAVFGFFFPWFMLLLTPLVIYPFLVAFGTFYLARIGRENDEDTGTLRFLFVFIMVSLVQVYVFGLPEYKASKLWFLIGNDTFRDFYFGWFIKGFWGFWNHLNYFASEDVPFSFYNFKVSHFQWVFWGGYVFVNGWMQFELNFGVAKDREERFEKAEASKKEAQEAFKDYQRMQQKEIEEEERFKQERIEAKERAKQEEIRLERLRKKKAEITDKDPWDSGFLG